LLTAAFAFLSLILSIPNGASPLQLAPKRPVVDIYHGEEVTDAYRWLENWDDTEVRAWSDAQNQHARAVLDSLPARAAIERRVARLRSWESPSYGSLCVRRGRTFALKDQPPKEQAALVILDSVDDPSTERTLVDPNAIDPSGSLTIDWFVPSWDGALVAVSMSRNGSESGDLHVFDVATATERHGDVVPRVNSGTAGGSLGWRTDGAGFWYTRHPSLAEVNGNEDDLGFFQKIYFHRLGEPVASDAYALGKELPRIAENFLESSENRGFVLDLVEKGDGGEFELFLLDPVDGAWSKVASYDDRVLGAQFAPDGALWLLSRKDAPRGKILRLDPGARDLGQARTILPEGPATIGAFEATQSGIWIVEQLGGPSRLRHFDVDGRDLGEVAILPVSGVNSLVRAGADEILFNNQSYLQPAGWYRLDANSQVKRTELCETSPVDMSGIEALRLTAVTMDGTRIPMTVLERRGTKRDGNNPALLTGYGGFDISMLPYFNKVWPVWLEQGGVIAVANLRGGAEFGEDWHKAGARTNKQNVFDDFIACAETLVQEKITRPARLAIQGGSNGGLLMGAALTQRPRLFRAVVAEVGYFDMLRYETRPNGVFNNTEYGSVANLAEYRALKAYSPYHRVRQGVGYPPTLFMTGANDPRVDPMHSRKMVARLQEVGATALLRTSGSTGHGGGTPLKEKIAEDVDVYTFLFSELGVTYRPVVE